jgi:2-polyprenyl-3-methyl-5-hydroxy-6-metoxy-1,4-benzoquinol methylase
MTTDTSIEAHIVASWAANASAWTAAVRDRSIESRKLVTDQAIVDAIVSRHPSTVLDIGCGEGWLARAVAKQGIAVVGIDVIPDLIGQAQAAGGGTFKVFAYDELAAGSLGEKADVVVCNFSLLGNESVDEVLRAVPSLLNDGGALIVQTLHPVAACGPHAYVDGWREGSWVGFDPAFVDPAPWYFRTMESWLRLFDKHELRLLEQREPMHPATRLPASVIFIAQV